MVIEKTVLLNGVTSEAFVQRFGALYESSPWIAERSYPVLSNTSEDSVTAEALLDTLAFTVEQASHDEKLALIKAHPDLAGKAAVQGALTAESTEEQAKARLDQCTPEEFEMFQSLNAQYKDKFGFPFIMAVRESDRADILKTFSNRLDNTVDSEFNMAIAQIHIIARLRLAAQLENT